MDVKKAATLLIFSTVLASGVAASSLGSFASENSKSIDSTETGFTISVFNLGSESLNLSISSTDPEDATVVHERQIELEPSEVTRNPDGDGTWFLTSNNRYVETKEIPVRLFIDEERSTDTFNFKVDLQATTSVDGEGGKVLQNIAQVRSYSFNVETTASQTADSGAGGANEPTTPTDGGTDSDTPQSPAEAPTGSGGAPNTGEFTQSPGFGQGPSNSEGSGNEDQSDDGDDNDGSDFPGFDRETDSQFSESEDSSTRSSTSNGPTGNFLGSEVNSNTLLLLGVMTLSLIYLVKVVK